MFNFADTEAATKSSFMKPGVYELKVTEVKLSKSANKGTAQLEITFTDEDDTSITEKFYLTEKAISRLQYLHVAFFGKICDKNFKSEEEVAKYFSKALTTKEIVKRIIVGGNSTNGRVYAELPYTDFVDTDEKFELGEFDEDSEEWKEFVRKGTSGSTVANKPNGILNDDDDDLTIGSSAPTPPAKTGKAEKAEKGAGKGKKTVEKAPTDDDDNDMPWD